MIHQLPSLDEAKRLWEANQREEARVVLEAVVDYQPQNEAAWLWLARASKDKLRQREALQRVLEINPSNALAQKILRERFGTELTTSQTRLEHLLGEVAFSENWAEAEALYDQILAIDPTQSDAVNALLRQYIGTQEWTKGFRLLRVLRDRAPNDAFLIDRQLKFAMRAGDLDYLRSLDMVLLKHPAVKADDLVKVSELFAKGRQFDVVAMLLERAAELDPQNQTILYGLANAYDITERPADARRARQRITDVDRHSELGKDLMTRFLEEDPYVPLSMRENTLVAVREAVGLMIPLVLVILLDNRLSILGGERVMAVIFGALGFYFLVTATSSHEQKIWQRIVPEGLNETLRYVLGGAGAFLVIVAVYFALISSFDDVNEFDEIEGEACRELYASIDDETRSYFTTLDEDVPCEWLYGWQPY